MASLGLYLSVCLFIALVKVLMKLWWTPLRIQSLMESQGIRGPTYKFLHGNIKEIVGMMTDEMKSRHQQELSHHTFPMVHPHIYSWIKLYGVNFLSWHGPKAQLVVNDPEMIKEILNNKDFAYQKPEIPILLKKLLGDGLVNSEGGKWSKMRKVANHAFHSESLKNMIPDMITSVEVMLERWRNHHKGNEIEVFDEFKVLTSEIISKTAFGSSFLEGQHIFDKLLRLTLILSRNRYNVRNPIVRKFVKTPDDVESGELEQEIRNSFIKMVKEREKAAKLEESTSYGKDFLGLLMKAYHDPDKTKRISIDDLIDECKTFHVGGQETTSSSLTWTILLLAIHTDWQEKARMEVLQSFGHQNPTSDDLGKLKIMSMIINESLRLYPPIVYITRKVGRKVRLREMILPADIEVFISALALHHNPNIWGADVHLFKPERFSEGVAKATNNNIAAFLPFGLGPRMCVGFNFAITETKIALSMILQRYRFTLSPAYLHSPGLRLTMYPRHGVQILIRSL